MNAPIITVIALLTFAGTLAIACRHDGEPSRLQRPEAMPTVDPAA